MKLQTPVTDERCNVGISYNDKIMMLGSCFSDSIGTQLKNFGFDVCVNPFGTLYNPASILSSIRRLISGDPFTAEECVSIGAGDGRICSFSHHTSFARGSEEDFIENANRKLQEAHSFFMECNKIIITLGTSWCFWHVEKGRIVSNCLKRNAAEFERIFLDEIQTVAMLNEIVTLCHDKEFIFTVSPIRHFKDGAHGNQLSKSALLLGIDDFLASCPVDLSMTPYYKADYFPAYEIMMDELRDYRFYAEDMCHPSAQAVGYLRDRFLAWALPSSEQPLLEENIRSFKFRSHKA